MNEGYGKGGASKKRLRIRSLMHICASLQDEVGTIEDKGSTPLSDSLNTIE